MRDIPKVSLGKLIALERRPVEIDPVKAYAEIGVYCFGRGIFHKTPRSGLEVGDKKLFLIQEGDFILQVTFAWEGAVAIASSADHGLYGSLRFLTFQVNEKLCFAPYLLNYFRTPEGLEQLVRISPGSAGRNRVLSIKRIPEVLVPLPSIAEQRRIVAHIEALTAKIEEARELRESAIVESQSLVTSLHVNLSGSRTVELNQILTLDERQEEVIFGKEFPQVGVKGFGGGLFAKESVNSTQTTYRAFNRLYNGALVLSQVKGWEGAIAVCPPSLSGKYVSPEYRTFSCRPGFAMPEYLASLVVTPWFWKQLKDLTRGMGGRRERTRPEQFLRMKLPMPTVDQQKYAVSVFEKVNLMKVLRDDALRKMEGLLPAILDKTLKGKL